MVIIITTYCGQSTFSAWTNISVGASSYITTAQFVLFQQRAANYMDNEITSTEVAARPTGWAEQVCAYVSAYYALRAKAATASMSDSIKFKVGDIQQDKSAQVQVLTDQAYEFLGMAEAELDKFRPASWMVVRGEPEAYSQIEETR